MGWCVTGIGLIIPQWTCTTWIYVRLDGFDRLCTQNEASERPGQRAAVLGQSAGLSHPRGAEIMPLDPAGQLSGQGFAGMVGIIRCSA